MARCSEDRRWMERALDLARCGEGCTRPNPPVGAVVVRNGLVVGEGYHRRAGGFHAERLAISRAGRQAAGATLYVTLEPCSTSGRTPPCTAAILNSGIARVVTACRDPDPRHNGRGLRLLREGGVRVAVGTGRRVAAEILAPFKSRIERGRPWVTLKLGISLDGRIADYRGVSRWITSPAARAAVQSLRRAADAVMVGSGTAINDDPQLLPRPAYGRKPRRVIVDSRGAVPVDRRVFCDRYAERTWWAVSGDCPPGRRRGRTRRGAQVLDIPGAGGHLDLAALMVELSQRGIMHVVCEGGGGLSGALLRAGLVDRCWLFVAPRWLGDSAGSAVAGVRWKLGCAPQWRFIDVRPVGPDVLMIARPAETA